MNSYILTLSILLMMALLTSSEVTRFAETTLQTHLFTDYQNQKELTSQLQAYGHYENFSSKYHTEEDNTKPKKKRNIQRSTSLKINRLRPPNNSRLNFFHLIQESHTEQQKEFCNIAALLMKKLYGHCLFFQEIPHAEQLILDELIQNKDLALQLEDANQLVSLPFKNTQLQEIFYRMMKGDSDCPPLWHFLTYEKHQGNLKKLNVLFADPVLLSCFFEDSEVLAQVLSVRELLWEEMMDQEAHRLERKKEDGKTRGQFSLQLKNNIKAIFLKHHVAESHFEALLDWTLGHSGTLIFMEDSKTGIISVEKYVVD